MTLCALPRAWIAAATEVEMLRSQRRVPVVAMLAASLSMAGVEWVPAHTKNDHVTVKVTASEQPVQTLQFAHRGLSNRSDRYSNRFVDRYLHHSQLQPILFFENSKVRRKGGVHVDIFTHTSEI